MVVFGEMYSFPIKLDFMAFAVLPFVIWAAIRFGVGITAFSILTIASIATVETALGSGVFASNIRFVNAVLLAVFFGVLSVSGLSLAAVISEREYAEREREQIVAERAGMEARLQANEAIRDNEERLRLAVQAGKMYAYDWDVATDLVVRSEEATNILGGQGEPGSLTRQQLTARVHPEDHDRFIAAVDNLTPYTPMTHLTYRVLGPNGDVIWLEEHGRAFFDSQGKMLRMIGMVTDITERKLAEEKLREYERAVEGVQELVVVLDRERRCLMANRAFLDRRKLAREQVVGRLLHEFVDKDIYESVIKSKLDECFQGKMVRYELKYRYPELGERDLLASYYPIEGENGVDRIACVLHDFTERKRAEQALVDMSRKLIEAQEHERTRIAREVHDDINQRLALLSVELEACRQKPPDSVAYTSLLLTAARGGPHL